METFACPRTCIRKSDKVSLLFCYSLATLSMSGNNPIGSNHVYTNVIICEKPHRIRISFVATVTGLNYLHCSHWAKCFCKGYKVTSWIVPLSSIMVVNDTKYDVLHRCILEFIPKYLRHNSWRVSESTTTQRR